MLMAGLTNQVKPFLLPSFAWSWWSQRHKEQEKGEEEPMAGEGEAGHAHPLLRFWTAADLPWRMEEASTLNKIAWLLHISRHTNDWKEIICMTKVTWDFLQDNRITGPRGWIWRWKTKLKLLYNWCWQSHLFNTLVIKIIPHVFLSE